MLPIAYQLEHKPVLVVGGGDVGTSRVERLLRAHADITLICPDATPELQELERQRKIHWLRRRADIESDLHFQPWAMVLTAIDDREASIEIAKLARELRIPVNAADIPDFCDFYFGSTIERGPLQVMVSTGGSAPRLARRIRLALEEYVDSLQIEGAIEQVAKLRAQLRTRLSGTDRETTKQRMSLMSNVCDEKSFEELAKLTDGLITDIIDDMLMDTDTSMTPAPEEPPVAQDTESLNENSDPETASPQPWMSLERESVQCGKGPVPAVPPYPFKQQRPPRKQA